MACDDSLSCCDIVPFSLRQAYACTLPSGAISSLQRIEKKRASKREKVSGKQSAYLFLPLLLPQSHSQRAKACEQIVCNNALVSTHSRTISSTFPLPTASFSPLESLSPLSHEVFVSLLLLLLRKSASERARSRLHEVFERLSSLYAPLSCRVLDSIQLLFSPFIFTLDSIQVCILVWIPQSVRSVFPGTVSSLNFLVQLYSPVPSPHSVLALARPPESHVYYARPSTFLCE